MLSALITVATVIPAFAAVTSYDTSPQSSRTALAGSDCWTRGLYNGNNGWYFAYSYYQNYSYRSYAKASLNGETVYRTNVIGYTACATTSSYQTTSGFAVSCSNASY